MYILVQCPNFGCDKELYRKEFIEHEKVCEHREMLCEKCGFKIFKDEDGKEKPHSCKVATQQKFEEMETAIMTLRRQVGELEEAMG